MNAWLAPSVVTRALVCPGGSEVHPGAPANAADRSGRRLTIDTRGPLCNGNAEMGQLPRGEDFSSSADDSLADCREH